MADSKKTNFTYRVNTKTPTEVEEWLATKPENLSYPEFVNAAIMVARSRESDSDLDLETVTNSLAEMVSAGGTANPAGAAGSSASPEEVAQAVSPVISQDGEMTRSHIDEAVSQLSEQIGSIHIPSPYAATAPTDGLGLEPSGATGIDAEEVAQSVAESVTESVTEAVAESVTDSVADAVTSAVQEDGDKTRESVDSLAQSVDRMGKDMSDILEIMQSAGDATGESQSDTSTNIIPDGQLTEDDLNFAVQRIKDTIRTDGQKTRNAIIAKIEQSIPEKEDAPIADAAVQPGLTSEDMQAMCDLIKQSNQAMIESLEQKIEAIQQAEAQGSRDIVFDEETTSFFKRIHSSVASILIRVDAMQAQLEHIQKMVERNGSTIRTMSRAVTPDDGRAVLPGGNQFGDATLFAASPEIEELESASSWDATRKRWENADDRVAEQTLENPLGEVAQGDGDALVAEQPVANDSDIVTIGGKVVTPTAEEEPKGQGDGLDLSSPEAIFGNILNGLLPSDSSGSDNGGTQERKPRITVPKRRRSHHRPVEEKPADGAEEAPADDDIMQPTGKIPVVSPGAESVDDIIDGLDFDSVGAVTGDPDELLTDTLQNLLG